MNLEEFRIAHSTLMEHYQFVERELEGIYAALSGKHFYFGLMDVEKFSISKVIQMVQEQEKNHDKRVILDAEYEDLKAICQRRNFWTHNCYTELVFDRKTGGPKRVTDIEQLYDDIRAAEQMRELLFDRKIELLNNIKAKQTFW
ncbi:MAG: hypothetical protein HDR11_09090 [Lachnospiraceae bacterium]|nr:hypothetical protein [Lachnospiraceae bacterium]